MHRLVVASLAAAGLSVGFGAAASAADLGRPAPAPVYTKAPIVAPWTWTGFYVGANVGGADGHLKMTDVGNSSGAAFASAGTAGQTFSLSDTNFLAGGQAGYNYQIGMGVFGIEGDLGWMGIKGSVLDPGTASNTMVGINSGLYGDVTGRAGLAFGPALFYAKGGWAFFDGKDTFSTTSAAFISASSTGMFSGWTAGGGLEYALGSNWSAKAEYLHFDFSSQSFNVLATGGTFPFGEKLTIDTVKVGLNYRFGGRY
jgi:outer membrane immunogenic protein